MSAVNCEAMLKKLGTEGRKQSWH